jgi:hypothetical protein
MAKTAFKIIAFGENLCVFKHHEIIKGSRLMLGHIPQKKSSPMYTKTFSLSRDKYCSTMYSTRFQRLIMQLFPKHKHKAHVMLS